MKIISKIIIIWVVLSGAALGQVSPNMSIEIIDEKENAERMSRGNSNWLNPDYYTPLSLIQHLMIEENRTKEVNVTTIMDEFPDDWVTKSDIETLMTMVESTQKCDCLVNPLSSNIPTEEDADVGGYAIKFLNAFRNQEKVSIGYYICPKTSPEEVEEIRNWWNEVNK
ncbi:MAG: hypothetical protein M9949_05525 [Candidatus Kapabacteria bacterium]|nr:hypothetical protein [Candidatus Kapabacteria bacterium]